MNSVNLCVHMLGTVLFRNLEIRKALLLFFAISNSLGGMVLGNLTVNNRDGVISFSGGKKNRVMQLVAVPTAMPWLVF